MTTLIGALGAVIAAFAALIAYFQWRTAHQRVVLDLFDRRIAVFREIEESAKGILVASSNASDMQKPFFAYIHAEANARFLFGQEVIVVLQALRSDIADVMAFTGIESGPDWEKLHDRKYQALQNITAFIQTKSAPLFAPYIRLDQKMPSLWWPRRN
jgi:hypothetical protein